MEFKQISGLIGQIAPTIAGAIFGPVGGLAAKALTQALGLNDGASHEDIENAILNATPEQLAAIKRADNDFKVQMKQLDIDLVKIAADDRANARNYAIQTHDLTPRFLAVVIVVCYGLAQYFLFTHVIDPSMRELVARVLGTIDGALMLVLSYYFGSSHQHEPNEGGK